MAFRYWGFVTGCSWHARRWAARCKNVPAREYGRAICRILEPNELFANVPAETQVWTSHGDQVSRVSDDFLPLAQTATCPFAAVKHRTLPIYGLQFHPEVTHTPLGAAILGNFLTQVCHCSGNWKLSDFAAETIRGIRDRVGDRRVICGLSGGVDSSVVAAMLSEAIGPRLSCILVDNGLLRKGEKESVIEEFTNHFKTDLHVVHAEQKFLAALAGVVNPQEKRRRIGHAFIDCFAEEAERIEGKKFLAQGTLYPDVIESGGSPDGPAATIKLHHNVGGLPENLEFELIEPLRDLFKDEVRKLGIQLGLPEDIVWRHPFPGPGLAVRCVGEVTKPRLDTLREADAIVVEEIKSAGLYRKASQAFAVLLPVQSVGVMGDARTYARRGGRPLHRDRRLHDGRLEPSAVFAPGPHFHADHQRSGRGQPRGVRHQFQAPGDDRVGVTPLSDATLKPQDAEQPNFEQALAGIESIVRELEEGQLGLEDALARYERGVKLLRQCHEQLRQAERRIELLAGVDAEGNPVGTPLDDAALDLGEKARQRSKRRSTPSDSSS